LSSLESLLSEIDSCRICAADLPLGPRPVLQCSVDARILIAGQAPGSRVHASGVPFDDPSGERLRQWMGIDRETFYDAGRIAILPMGFCYPGSGSSGDLPPRPECAAHWREALLSHMQQLELVLVLGQYAQRYHLSAKFASLTELVRSWRDYWPGMLPLPHPSPRNNRWLSRNPWFAAEILPVLQTRIKQILDEPRND
jgi:uracil-DNA glycosylase